MRTIFERPTLNRPTPQQNIAVVDRWISDTVDKLNSIVEEDAKEIEGDIPTALADLTDDSSHRLVTDGEIAAWNNKADRSKAYLVNDNEGAEVDNADFFPFYDTSAQVKKKTTWSNIKSVLKTAFDSLYAAISHTHTKSDITDFPTLATVATSGSYNDLSNKPTIPAAQVNSDWNASSGVAQILNKPTIPAEQIQSDWDQTDTTAKDYIKNKPQAIGAAWGSISGTLSDQTDLKNELDAKADTSSLATVATSGSYSDLTGKPTIPTVNNATLTIQKNGTTVNTFTANSSTNKTVNITVPTFTVYNGLDSSSTVNALSANQGRLLNNKITDVVKVTSATKTISSVGTGATSVEFTFTGQSGYKPILAVYGGQGADAAIFPFRTAKNSFTASGSNYTVTLNVKNMRTSAISDVTFTAFAVWIRS